MRFEIDKKAQKDLSVLTPIISLYVTVKRLTAGNCE